MKAVAKPASAAAKSTAAASAAKPTIVVVKTTTATGVKPSAAKPSTAMAKPPAAAVVKPAVKGAVSGKPITGSAATAVKSAATTVDAVAVSAAAAAISAAEAAAAEAAATAAAVEATAALATLDSGTIIVHYADYHPIIPIVNGSTTAEVIDEELALTYVYPNCEIQLTQVAVKGIDWRTVDWAKLESRSVDGVFAGLRKDTAYWAVVVEDGAEKLRYEKDQAARAASFNSVVSSSSKGVGLLKEDRQLSIESCSCIEGTPCATPECCRDFAGRFEVSQTRTTDASCLRCACVTPLIYHLPSSSPRMPREL